MLSSVVYYTDHNLPAELAEMCAAQLQSAAAHCEIVTVALHKPAKFGDEQITLSAERGILTMHRQILAGLERAAGEIVFLCEHDVLYHPSHFEIGSLPPAFVYNTHVWHVRYPDCHAVYYDARQVSGLCAPREMLVDYYSQRIEQIQRAGFNGHYEPGLRQSVGSQRVEDRRSTYPNLDVRHGHNLTASKWSKADFRNAKYSAGWQEADTVAGWGRPKDVFEKGVILWH